jgi:hypothetical protein
VNAVFHPDLARESGAQPEFIQCYASFSPGGVIMSEANKLLMEDWFEKVWNQQNTAAIDAMFHADGLSHGFPQADSVLVGPEEFKAIHRNF